MFTLEVKDCLPNLEQFSVQKNAQVLANVFRGYRHRLSTPPEQLQWLVKTHYIIPIATGDPPYTLTYPWDATQEDKTYWNNSPMALWPRETTTQKYVPNAPHIDPTSVSEVPQLVTVTDTHHYFGRGTNDLLITINTNGLANHFVYKKGGDPIHPEPLVSLSGVSDLLSKEDALIQLWDHRRNERTYYLQVALQVRRLSFQSVLRVLHANPDTLPPINPKTS